MNVIQISSQILILSISLILSINLVNGFNVCNVEINNLDSAFIVNDTQYNNEILIVDSSGNLYLHGRDRYLLNYNTQNSLYLSDSLFFNRITSKFNNILENQVTFPQTNSLLIKDSNEEIVASFSSSNNNIYLK